LRHYAASQEVAGSIPDDVIGFLSIYLTLLDAILPRGFSVSNRNEYQKMFLGSKSLPSCKADNLTAIYATIA
jgi:hypothetical protein